MKKSDLFFNFILLPLDVVMILVGFITAYYYRSQMEVIYPIQWMDSLLIELTYAMLDHNHYLSVNDPQKIEPLYIQSESILDDSPHYYQTLGLDSIINL